MAFQLNRRQMLLGSGALFAWAHMPRLAMAEGRDPRLLVILLRGALDGLAAVSPAGDPDWARLRGDQALTTQHGGLALDNFFVLNSAMPNFHRLYRAGHATVVHATATPYRERSHFDGQDLLESGISRVGASESGWLNRALFSLRAEGRVGGHTTFAVGPIAPLVTRGPAQVMMWTPARVPPASVDTITRLLELYRHSDPALATALEERVNLATIAQQGGISMGPEKPRSRPTNTAGLIRAYFAEVAGGAARFMARPDGPRIGALAFDGWDTHANEGATDGQLAIRLAALDDAIAAFEAAMGNVWQQTAIAIVTEFGRTARINGTAGTDHGTATVALLVGGALKGGRVIADWPGLRDNALHEGRDLKPTTDLRSVLKGLLRDHVRVDEKVLAEMVFPGSADVKPISGLLA